MSEAIFARAQDEEEKSVVRWLERAKRELDIPKARIIFEALKQWRRNDYHEYREQQIHFPTNSGGNPGFRKDVAENIEKIKTRLRGEEEILKGELKHIISEAVKRKKKGADPRTVKKYIERLKKAGVITGSRPLWKSVAFELNVES